MKRILIVTPNWIGDALLTTTALQMLRRTYPHAEISVLAVPRVADVFRRNRDVVRVILNEEGTRPFWYPLALIQQLGKYDFDAAFLFHRSRSRAIWTFLAGIPVRVGYNSKRRGIFLTHGVEELVRAVHRVEGLNYLLNRVGITGKAPAPVFVVGGEARERMRRRMGSGKFAILNPGGNWMPKRWPVERFAKLADLLGNRLDLRVVITGGAGDRYLAQQIQNKASIPVVSTAGETTLEELGALAQAAEIFVSNDSGPMHVAAAVGTPLVALFGPTSAKITGPVGPGKITVLQKDIGLPVPNPDPMLRDMRYMEAIEVEEVFQAAEQLLHAENRALQNS